MAGDGTQKTIRFFAEKEKHYTHQKHAQHPQESRDGVKNPLLIHEYQAEMRNMRKGKGRAIYYGGFFLADRIFKTLVYDAPEKQFLSDGTKYHARDGHNNKHDPLICCGDVCRNFIRLADVLIPVLV